MGVWCDPFARPCLHLPQCHVEMNFHLVLYGITRQKSIVHLANWGNHKKKYSESAEIFDGILWIIATLEMDIIIWNTLKSNTTPDPSPLNNW